MAGIIVERQYSGLKEFTDGFIGTVLDGEIELKTIPIYDLKELQKSYPNTPCLVNEEIVSFTSPTDQICASTLSSINQLDYRFVYWNETRRHVGPIYNDPCFRDICFSDRFPRNWKEIQDNGEEYASCMLDRKGVRNEADLLVSTGRSYSGWHVDSQPALPVVATLLNGYKMWFFMPPGRELWTTCQVYGKDFKSWATYLKNHGSRSISYAVQEAGQSIYFPAVWGHTVLTIKSGDYWSSMIGKCLELPEDEEIDNQEYVDMRYITGYRRDVTGRAQKKKRKYSGVNGRMGKKSRTQRADRN